MSKSYSDLDTIQCHLAQLETCFDVRLQRLQGDEQEIKIDLVTGRENRAHFFLTKNLSCIICRCDLHSGSKIKYSF